MKILIAFLCGILVTTIVIRPAVRLSKPEIAEVHDTITKVAYSYARQAHAIPGKFSRETLQMLAAIMCIDSSEAYTEPDSLNTRIFCLNAWPVEEETILLETYAGNAGGSCGPSIYVARYDNSLGTWVRMLSECGYVDTLLPVSHNGLYDFVIRDKWDQDHYAYRFNGKEIVEADFYYPLSDVELVAIDFDYGKFYLPYSDIQISYIRLGSDSLPYMIVYIGISEKYFYRKDEYNHPVRINFFENAYQFDFLEEHHNGMPDVRTFDALNSYTYYEWDGTAYIAVRTERWVCPV